jgi:hypothetical protein
VRTIIALACLAALAAPALAVSSMQTANGYGALDAPRDIDPQHLGLLFCDARIKGDMTPIEKYYAPKLVDILADLPPDTPIPWQGMPNHPTSCGIKILNGFDDTVGVLVEIDYASGVRHWADTLNLERTPDSWRLNNIFYEGGGNLRFRLLNSTP